MARKKATKKKATKKDRPEVDERLTEINANDLVIGDPCTLTPDCPGTIYVYQETNVPITDDRGRLIRSEQRQFLKCKRCDRLPINPRTPGLRREEAATSAAP